ncbi:DUF84 family protein [Virgibacillus xinjiangensis]|uniref:inosine/xanthosine triphosphatase n=1 Tax=Virgibacillus xinjiangensis TaxID=393090 RepID=A0ABV7CUY4_9BACI
MKIIVGSKNETKIGAVKENFAQEEVITADAPSLIPEQPFSDEETRSGAVNRAMGCFKYTNGDLAIGLEGGVMEVDGRLYLCNWGALVTRDGKIHTASGARILLPAIVTRQLKEGRELGDIMDSYAKREGIRHREGAIGVFTNEQVTRQEMFSHVVKLLRGQWEFGS